VRKKLRVDNPKVICCRSGMLIFSEEIARLRRRARGKACNLRGDKCFAIVFLRLSE
jgi:hypothetical protein